MEKVELVKKQREQLFEEIMKTLDRAGKMAKRGEDPSNMLGVAALMIDLLERTTDHPVRAPIGFAREGSE